MKCNPQRQQDEYFCDTCHRRWHTDDAAPCNRAMIVGIGGAAGAGKSTLAEYLVREHGFHRVKFADTLKGMLRVVLSDLGFTESEATRAIEGDMKEVTISHLAGKTPRHAMQTLGTEWGRKQMDDDFWVKIAEVRINSLLHDGVTRVVIDDLRFDNEAALIRSYDGGQILRISRRGVGPKLIHKSEHGIDWSNTAHKVLFNDNTPYALFTRARSILGVV